MDEKIYHIIHFTALKSVLFYARYDKFKKKDRLVAIKSGDNLEKLNVFR